MTPLDSLQATLAGEHAAVYLYGLLGGRTSYSAEPALWEALRQAFSAHRTRRDQVEQMVRRRGAEPVAAEVAYVAPSPARTPGQVRAAAREVEARCAAVYSDQVGSTTRGERAWALDALADSAVRVLGFGAEAENYPGLPELS